MPEILQDWVKDMPDCKNINMYGITETTVHVTYKEITEKEITANKSNIGSPIPTLSCYVLDENMLQVPIGVIGELYVSGAGVARGYLGRPKLTAERFIRNTDLNSERLYRSGDYVRLLSSGDFEYVGRKDDQVKIRGHRIEITEVEAVIRQQKNIRDAVVISIKNDHHDSDLIGYVLFDGKQDVSELRSQLRKHLPSYMIPSALIAIDEIPLNRNGKLDRKSLPKPQDTLQRETEHFPARNNTDKEIISIWENVLDRDSIGIKDSFFDLGGHSLKATRVVSKIHELYEIKIDLKYFFNKPTIENLSDYIETLRLLDTENVCYRRRRRNNFLR